MQTQNTYTALLQQRLITEQQFGDIILKSNESGAQIRLKDVARVGVGNQVYNLNSTTDGLPSSAIAIYSYQVLMVWRLPIILKENGGIETTFPLRT